MRTRCSAVQRCLYGLIASSTLMLVGAPMTAAYASGDAPGILVRYHDYEPGTDAGARRLLHRIEVAAHEVCFDQDLEPLPLHAAAQRCYLAAVAQAVKAVHAPRMTAAYLAKYGPAAPAAPSREAQESRVPGLRHIRQG
ncbi:MAG TPA: UrcA family protein [Steroidobacteraceae bacterium]|nr:UrcA family protein [Steroidobacteraceae bacterium]